MQALAAAAAEAEELGQPPPLCPTAPGLAAALLDAAAGHLAAHPLRQAGLREAAQLCLAAYLPALLKAPATPHAALVGMVAAAALMRAKLGNDTFSQLVGLVQHTLLHTDHPSRGSTCVLIWGMQELQQVSVAYGTRNCCIWREQVLECKSCSSPYY